MLYKQIIKFIISGATATLVYSIVFICAIKLKIPSVLSHTFAFLISFVINFLIQSKWVFTVKKFEKLFLIKFIIIALLGFMVNSAIVFLVMDVFNQSEYLSIATMVVTTPVLTFTLNKLWVFS